ncbi:MAG: PstS family phosphate ABC transporter substrate-binding protein [Acidimicrobiales bacterium]
MAVASLTAACGGGSEGGGEGGLSGSVRIDGSSTVAPLSEAAAELFQAENSGVRVTVGTSGTGGGFEKFCAGETDISDASRAIEEDEIAACEAEGVRYEELRVALDGLSVVVNPENDWAECLTVDQLSAIWEPDSKVNNWKQVDPAFPDVALDLFGAGTDSGTFDYFTAAINGEEGASRTDYNATEDDNVTVTGVSGTRGALGYLGLSFVEQNSDSLKGVRIDGGQGCVAPSVATVQDGTYSPLGRPLFIYVSAAALDRPEVAAFVNFYIENSTAVAEQALFVPLTEAQAEEARTKVAALADG